jgi:Domain of unknown function (DUF1918)
VNGAGEEGHGDEGDGEERHGEEGEGSSFVSARKGACAWIRKAVPSRIRADRARSDSHRLDSGRFPPRQGEVLEVIHGEVSVSYRVRWADGHETLIAPKSGPPASSGQRRGLER